MSEASAKALTADVQRLSAAVSVLLSRRSRPAKARLTWGGKSSLETMAERTLAGRGRRDLAPTVGATLAKRWQE